jgi:hypothetical protein
VMWGGVAWGQSVVINKYRNVGSNADIIELLVVQNQADLRSLVLKDFSGSNANDTGGSLTFTTKNIHGARRVTKHSQRCLRRSGSRPL